MSPRRQAFVEQYVACGNGAEAARRAGYSPRSADRQAERLLRNDEIKAEVRAERQKLSERVHVDEDWVLDRLIRNAERALQAEPVVDREGEEIGQYRYEGQVANRALELIGKYLGMFDEYSRTLILDITKMTPDERKRRIAELDAKRRDRVPGPTGVGGEGAGGG